MDSEPKRTGRPPKYASDEERKAADAERKRRSRSPARDGRVAQTEERGLQAGDAPVPDDAGSTPAPPPVGTDKLQPLEDYIAEAVFMAELHHSQASPQATMSTKTLADQIERAEAYARWRYEGYLLGEIVGL